MRSESSRSPENFEQSFSVMTDNEIVQAFNNQVGNPGWTSSRANYISALHAEMVRRFDCTAVGNEAGLSLVKKIEIQDIDGKKVVKLIE